MNGIFAVKKPVGPTSQDVVGKLKKLFTNTESFKAELAKTQQQQNKNSKFQQRRNRHSKWIKIGHGGTLDPLASGVLVIGVGSGTKQLQQYLGNCTKRYEAVCLFGASTTTYDSEGAILGYGSIELTDEKVKTAVDKFTGTIQQLPPVFSALKMDGKPLYEYARERKPLPRPVEKRECTITDVSCSKLEYEHEYKFPTKIADESEIEFAKTVAGEDFGSTEPVPEGPIIRISFSVTSGTYIRSLINDIGHELGTQAHMVALKRTEQGEWSLRQNVLDLTEFDKEESEWRPVLENALEGGTKAVFK